MVLDRFARQVVVCVALTLPGLRGAPVATSTALPAILPADPALIAHAKSHGIPVDGIDRSGPERGPELGDNVTALITLRDAGKTKQWLVTLLIAAPTAAERVAHPPQDSRLEIADDAFTYHAGDLRALEIKTIGPVVAGRSSPIKEEQARALISGDLLAHGLDQGCRILMTATDPARERAVPEMTREAKQLLGGMVVALIEFVHDVQSTPGVRDILWDVMEKPSLWSFVKGAGKIKLDVSLGENAGVTTLIRPEVWPTFGQTLYRLGVMLAVNGKPALQVGLVVGPPEGPLVTTAGILGIAALAPTVKGRRVDLQILAAHTGNAQ